MLEARLLLVNRTAAATVILLTLLALTQSLAGEAGTRAGLLTRQNLRARNLQELWSLRRGFLQAEQPQKALEIEELLRLWRRQNGVLKAVELAGALVMEGYENLDQRRFTRARRAFHLALEFDSGMSRAHLGLGRVAWESGEGLWAVAGHNRRALQALWRSRQRRSVLVRNALWAVATGIPVGVGLVCLLLLLKVGPLVHHRQAALLAARLPPTTSSVLALLIPWLPLALPAGSGWIPLFWILLAAPYLSRRERMAAMSALLAVAVCGAMAAPLLQSTRRSADPLLSDLAAAAEGAVSPGGEKSLATLAEKAPDDAILQFFLAGQARGLGHHALALRAYRRAAELDPQLAQASNNLGTLLASLGREASAVQAFHRAIQAAPSDLIAYYNLYLTQQHRFDFEAAEQTLAQAQKIDLPGITALMSQRNERQARLNLIEARLPVQIALDHALKALNPSSPASSLRPMFLSWSWPLVVLPLGTVFLLLGRRRRPGWPVSCGLCGRITCKHCALDSGRQSRCASCQALAGQQRSLPRMVRKKKKAAIAAYQRRKARTCRALAVLIPGAGQIWAGRAVAGSLLLVTASIAALALILGPSLPEFPRIVMEPGLSGPSLGAILLLLCTWMASWILPVSSPEATRTLRARSRRT